ncbi:ROK family transcriptional regulator [Schaalia sp. Marseille-Q2122]|uniref:ROK family transcriptional regulator n=1 Tax=Schaalia sp. Marseille-Q2122 TaxID=2736604 RepID=UPI00158A1183|nr:ROK family transcriptional regulator [Schaalia sp. Marseille-Q2122]
MRLHSLASTPLTPCLQPGTPSPAASGVTAHSLRAKNLSLVLRQILSNPGTISRASIANYTGTTRATISRLVDELISAGLVEELAPSSEPSRGRPAIRLQPQSGRYCALGLEVNVSTLKAQLIDLSGEILAFTSCDNPVLGDPATTMAALNTLGQDLLDQYASTPLTFIGSALALPGIISAEMVAKAPNLQWENLPLNELLAPITNLHPRTVTNEADLAAYAIAHPRPGVPGGPASFMFVSGEVGVGAGLVLHHAPFSGANGWAGEIGHVCVDPSGPTCKCGATGCLESFLGRCALARHAGLPETTPPLAVCAEAEAGNETAQAALHQGAIALGRALSAAVNITDIPLVILGGNLADIAPHILETTQEIMSMRILQSAWTHPQIEILEDSANLAVTGAAHRVLQDLVDDPACYIL